MKVVCLKLEKPANEYEANFVARKYVMPDWEDSFLKNEAKVNSWLDLKGKRYHLILKNFYNTLSVERMEPFEDISHLKKE